MIIGFLSGLFIAAVAGVAVMSLLLLQRKRGMSYDNNRESYRCRERRTKDNNRIFDGIKSSICDNYCKYPGEIKDYDELIETVCSKCPLRKLN
jgi:hypothetical protein